MLDYCIQDTSNPQTLATTTTENELEILLLLSVEEITAAAEAFLPTV